MRHRIDFSPEARDDLIELYEWLADRAGPLRAMAYIDRIEAHCRGMAQFPERGTRRDHLRPGLRTVGFERRVTIAFSVDRTAVTVLRVLYGGRDLENALAEGRESSRET